MKLLLVLVFIVAGGAASQGEGVHCQGEQSRWCDSLHSASSCHVLSYCLQKVWEPWNVRVQETKECRYSQKIVRTIRRVIAEQEGLVTGEAKYLITSMCKFIHDDKIRKQCKDLVTDFLPEIKTLMNSNLEPATVATVMGLCQPQEDSMGETMTDKGTDMHKQKAGNTVECQLCEMLVGSVDQYLTKNKTEGEVKQFLEGICHKLPSQISSQCLSFVDEYAAVVVQLLVEEELNPVQVCQTLKLCNSSAVLVTPTKKVGLPAIFCTVCEVLVGMMETQIAKNATEADIEKTLDIVCLLLPANLSSLCVNVIRIYVPVIIDLLEQEEPPNKICEKIHLCNATVSVALPEVFTMERQRADPVKCDLCKFVMTEIKSLLGDPSSEQAIIHAVETVCDVVQGDLRLQCKSEVENYGPAVLDLVRHMDDPTQFCTYLQLCASTPSVHSSPYRVQMMVGSEECTRGPFFWCATMENARKCGMVQECVKKYGLKP